MIVPPRAGDVRRRRQHHHRQRRALRRDERRGLHSRHRRRAVRRPQQRRERRRRGRRRSRVRVHDRRARRHSRPHGPELRGGHERRHRLRARRDRDVRRRCNHGAGRSRAAWPKTTTRRSCAACSSATSSYTDSAVALRLLAEWPASGGVVREGHAARLQARAARPRQPPASAAGTQLPLRRWPMGKPTGFLEVRRQKQPTRPVLSGCATGARSTCPTSRDALRAQTSRCMDCGIPFCHQGCPLGNLIPTGTIWSTAIAGRRRSIGCTRRTIFPS